MFSPLLQQLVQHLRCLPGVGPKSAQRMALHLLERNKEGGLTLAHSLIEAIERIGHCQQCRTLTEMTICELCSNIKRNSALLCIVESPADVIAIEETRHYRGLYFVLRGHLSPIDGIGPNDIGIPELIHRIENNPPEEVILATNPTVEGEATAHYIAEQLQQRSVSCSRIAHGVPIGGELEYLDSGTLTQALSARTCIEAETTN